jgi:uncharacterized small protein (DUF1192 family)
MPIDADDLEPLRRKAPQKDLDALSVEELNDYVAAMEAEIARVRGKIKAKQSHAAAAAAFFKK